MKTMIINSNKINLNIKYMLILTLEIIYIYIISHEVLFFKLIHHLMVLIFKEILLKTFLNNKLRNCQRIRNE
jgi:hypothetical protein